MSFLYLTADKVGIITGGGTVTQNESAALQSLGPCKIWDRKELDKLVGVYVLPSEIGEPWEQDALANYHLNITGLKPRLTHIYSGTFSETVAALQKRGSKVVYTIAAHSVEASRKAHETFGIDYARCYPHLVEPELWQRYSTGYRLADVLVCPSKHSYETLRSQGMTQRIEIIPHGCHLPEKVTSLPKRFTCGYLGCCAGPDKGLIYLLQAWKQLNYKDATLLLAGRDSTSTFVKQLVEQFGGGCIELVGWINSISDFYNRLSVYIQPSLTEGFGCEILEGMAYARPVICSTGAGAQDLVEVNQEQSVEVGATFSAGNVDHLASLVDRAKNNWDLEILGKQAWSRAENYTWTKIKERYLELWREILGEKE